jgi:hypothetical protein
MTTHDAAAIQGQITCAGVVEMHLNSGGVAKSRAIDVIFGNNPSQRGLNDLFRSRGDDVKREVIAA